MNRVMTTYSLGAQSVRKQSAFTKLDFLKTKLVLKLSVLGAFIVFLSLFYIWSRVQVVQLGYEINEIRHEQSLLLDQNKKLGMELAVLKSPERLRRIAQDQLGMSLPETQRLMTVE